MDSSLPDESLKGQPKITEFFTAKDKTKNNKKSKQHHSSTSTKLPNKSGNNNQTPLTNQKVTENQRSTRQSQMKSKNEKLSPNIEIGKNDLSPMGEPEDKLLNDQTSRDQVPSSENIKTGRKANSPKTKLDEDSSLQKGPRQKRSISSSESSSEGDADGARSSLKQTTQGMNLEFYRNKLKSQPRGDYIENILDQWKDDFKKLESHHGYIQWLFPLREDGMNSQAQVLQDHEAEAIRKDPVLQDRLLRSYKMMLSFYGLQLDDEATGAVDLSKQHRKQIAHLNSSFHNNLRITRILKSLGELGYEHLKKPLVECLIKEAFQKKTLTNCQRSCTNFWIPTIKNDHDRKTLEKMVKDAESTYETRRHTRSYEK